MRRVTGALEEREFLRAQRPAAAGPRQDLGHQAAARVRDQVDARPGGHRLHQRERVGNRALGECRMVQRVHAPAVMAEQPAHDLWVRRPQFAEGADGVHEGAVDEHQQRAAIGGGPDVRGLVAAFLERRRQRVGGELVHARVDGPVELACDRGSREIHRGVLGNTCDHFDGAQHRLAHPAARGAARSGGLQPGPAQARGNGHRP